MDEFSVFGRGSSQEEPVKRVAQSAEKHFPTHRLVLAVMGIHISIRLRLELWLCYLLLLNFTVLISPSKEWRQDHPIHRVAVF